MHAKGTTAMFRPPSTQPPVRRRQRGVSLFVVIVFVLLSMLLAVWASRTALFSEMLVSNDADHQRAFEAAQALLQDAELDIRGETASGTECAPVASDDRVCRRGSTMTIPLEAKEVANLLADLDGVATTRCKDGLCLKRAGRQDFWNATASTAPPANDALGEATLASMAVNGVGARYGQYTGARPGTSATPANPLLADTGAANRGGWYWIEVLPYDESSKTSGLIVPASGQSRNLLSLNINPNVVYRITALAYGRRPGTVVVLQQTYAQHRRKD